MKEFSHLDKDGNVYMVDVTEKQVSMRTAKAEGKIFLSAETIHKMKEDAIPKGNVLTTAKLAGIQAAKKTSELIPMCHQLQLSHVDLTFELKKKHIIIRSIVKTKEATGVEMEALTAVSASALTIYDMCKALDKDMVLGEIALINKKGGTSSHTVTYRPLVGIITMSDGVAAGSREDKSGKILSDGFKRAGCSIQKQLVLPDGSEELRETIQSWIDSGVELIMTTGGTGLGPRDLTISLMETMFNSRLPGIEQALHAYGRGKLATASLSRLAAGVVGPAIVICLPGSPGAVRDGLVVLIPAIFHAYHMMKGEGH
tara:strand:+ start:11354 stop:12295 length:942 start_codon:yes stop_codon:yes gene_type:complete